MQFALKFLTYFNNMTLEDDVQVNMLPDTYVDITLQFWSIKIVIHEKLKV